MTGLLLHGLLIDSLQCSDQINAGLGYFTVVGYPMDIVQCGFNGPMSQLMLQLVYVHVCFKLMSRIGVAHVVDTRV